MHYDNHYKKGGFRYKTSFGKKHINSIQTAYSCFTPGMRVLDAPCGDGFWSKILRSFGCTVTSTDLSPIGAKLANGICHNLEDHNPDWSPHKFDLVFCRGISHLHHRTVPIQPFWDVLNNLMQYAPKVLIIYSTTQSNKMVANHFHHTRKELDKLMCEPFKSRMISGYYTALIDSSGIESDLPNLVSSSNNSSKT